MRFALGLGFWLLCGVGISIWVDGEAAAGYGFFVAVFGSFITLLTLEHYAPNQELQEG